MRNHHPLPPLRALQLILKPQKGLIVCRAFRLDRRNSMLSQPEFDGLDERAGHAPLLIKRLRRALKFILQGLR